MIKPSVGRVVLFYPHADEGEPEGTTYAALVAKVLDDRSVNLAIFNSSGAPFSRQAVQLLQDDDAAPATGHYAAWMPYQVGQAAKTEAAQAAAAPAPAVDLKPIHDRIDTIEKGLDGKFTALGDWLRPLLEDLDAKIAAVTAPPGDAPQPDTPPPAPQPPAPALAPDATAAAQPAPAAPDAAQQPV